MALSKQGFYEGAALRELLNGGELCTVRQEAPCYLLNGAIRVLIKYSTAKRTPWGFTFNPSEFQLLAQFAATDTVFVGLVCGSDGVAAVSYEELASIVGDCLAPARVACFRKYNQHYEVSGPLGSLRQKVSPSLWRRLVSTNGGSNATS